MFTSHRSRKSSLTRLATCALAGSLVWACNGSDDDPAPSSATDAGSDTSDSGAEHTDSDVGQEAAPPADAKEADVLLEDASSAVTCELLANGTCSPPAQPNDVGCNGCYEVKGQRYDTTANCLLDEVPVTITCTTLCVSYGGQCYQRVVEGTTEVVAMNESYEDPKFEQETGFTPCNSTLGKEVMTASPCP